MKGKKFTYLLIGCVGLVWTLIFYRIYAALNEEDALPVAAVTIPKQEIGFVDHSGDRYTLALDYADPFDRKQSAVSQSADQTEIPAGRPVQASVPMPVLPAPVDWSAVRYTGFISNAATKTKLAMMQINGADHTMRVGDSFGGVRLLKNNGDSVLVLYKNKTRHIRMNMSGAPHAAL